MPKDRHGEDASLESEASFRELSDAAPVMIWTADAGGRRVYFNARWLEFAGRGTAEEVGEGWASRIHRRDREAYEATFNAAFAVRQPFECQYRLRRHDGVFRHVLERGAPRIGADGVLHGYVGSCTDVTEFREAEEIARISRAAYQHLFDSNLIGIGLCDLDAIRDANQALLDIVGESRDGLPILWQSARPPDSIDPHLGAIAELERLGACQPYEVEWLRRDGRRQSLLMAGARITADPLQWVAMVANVTEPREAVKALQASEQRLRRIVDSNIIGIAFWRAEGPIGEANDAFLAMAGRTRAELDAHRVDWREIVAPEFHAPHERALDEMRASGRCTPFESCFIRPDGSRLPILCAGAAFEIDPLHGVTWIVDLTDRKRAEAERERLLALAESAREEAEAANRAKDVFLATMSHELRGPLAPILAWARMLLDGQVEPSQTRQALEAIERNARMQTQMVDDLLDVSRIGAGKLRLELQPVALARVVENAVESVRLAASEKNVTVLAALDADTIAVEGDPDRLQQIVWNLLSNALKFTPSGGRIDVGLKAVGAEAEITVRDTGTGIAPDLLPRLFERFWQADASPSRGSGGLGLGLSIVRDLTELHGGRVSAESAGPGRGSTFTVRLPISSNVPVEDDTQATRIYASRALARLANVRVLIVDDDRDSREAIRVVLHGAGAEVRAAASAADALETMRRWLPDVIVSDIAMPGEDGYSLLGKVRAATGDLARVPALALTAYGSLDDVARARSAGFQRHITKPADPAELVVNVAMLAAQVSESA